jgi:hypothetical protein
MNSTLGILGMVAMIVSVACASSHSNELARPPLAAAPCAVDSNYQRLSFWVGDWDVFDSVGTRYASQRVRAVLDACAITAEWTGPVGDKGLSLSAFDVRAGEWRQTYTSNQIPSASGVALRKSDPTYHGPGLRFIPLVDPSAGDRARTRVTIMPLSDHRALQLFESSRDGGETWHTAFKAEHRMR